MEASRPAGPVTVYWRPGCPYCARLRLGLRRIGLVTDEVNIWDNPEAAATVRAFAAGNETVPTVVVGNTGLVNPSVAAVMEVVRTHAPGLIAGDGAGSRTKRQGVLPVAQWVLVAAVVTASLISDAVGNAGLSWGLDGVAVTVYLGFRIARR
ncbi:MAG: glutaredoxin domain-containing protein [Acidimicrobiales bacterium]